MRDDVIHIEHVSKTIGQRQILDHVDLRVASGQMYGISGRNGAGKSILLRVIAGLALPSDGYVHVFGETIGRDTEFPKDTGAMIDGPGLLPQYSGYTNLHLLAMIRNQISADRIKETLRLVGLDPLDKRPVRTYSTGMRQRLGLAQALMEHPRLILLDEPTSAIDREGRKAIHDLLKALHAQGITIVLTSHSEEELATLCDTVYTMTEGKLVC